MRGVKRGEIILELELFLSVDLLGGATGWAFSSVSCVSLSNIIGVLFLLLVADMIAGKERGAV